MPEGEAIGRFLDDQLRGDQLLDTVEQFPLVAAQQALQQREIDARSSDGGSDERLPCGGVQLPHTPLDGILHGARDPQRAERGLIAQDVGIDALAARGERFERLLDEEGIALGQGGDGLEEIALHGAVQPEDGAQHRVDLGHGQGSERQLNRPPFAVEFREEMDERGRRLAAAIGGQQEERPCRDLAGEVEQELERRVVGPMQIFEHEDHRRGGGDMREQARQGMEEPVALLLGIGRQRGWRDRPRGGEFGE